jgi:hypothetical protein
MNCSPLSMTLRGASAAALSLAVLAGCDSTGLSPREAAGRNFSSYVYALKPHAGAADAPPARLVLPAKVAVAQVGEVTPPTAFLKKLRSRPELFSRVEPVSGAETVEPQRVPPPGDSTITAGERAREEMDRMLAVARDMGMDQLLLVGGTIDQATKENGLSLLDLTIVGAFVVPSKQVEAEARASGALIDLASGRVTLFASADASRGRLASSATQSAGELDVMREARDEVLAKLAAQVIAQCEQRTGTQSVTAPERAGV